MKTSTYFLSCFLFLCLLACSGSNALIIDKPIIFDGERVNLTLEYLSERYGLERDTPQIEPKMIVLHWTYIPTMSGSYDVFNASRIAGWREYVQKTSGLNVSAHFLVDQEGVIYRLMPETTMARHVIGLNHCAIGIENVGGTKETPLTRAQVRANIFLVNYLANKYDIEYLIGHYEYTRFEGHELWLEKDKGYRTEKTDPGPDFMRKVRKATKRFNFKPVPN